METGIKEAIDVFLRNIDLDDQHLTETVAGLQTQLNKCQSDL